MSHNTTAIETISDPAVRKFHKQRCAHMVESSVHFSEQFLTEHNWVAIPVESSLHFNEEDADRLARAIAGLGCGYVFAVATEEVEDELSCYKVPATVDGLLTFSKQCSHFHYLLTPPDDSFAILCTVDDYFVVAGPEPFVVESVGGPIAAARQSFHEFANNDDWPADVKAHLLSVSERYSPS